MSFISYTAEVDMTMPKKSWEKWINFSIQNALEKCWLLKLVPYVKTVGSMGIMWPHHLLTLQNFGIT